MSIPLFDSLDEMWINAAQTIIQHGELTGSRDGETKEILGYVGRLADPRANFMFNPIRKQSPAYAAIELLWYLSGTASVELLLPYAPQYKRFADSAGEAFGAYGARWKYVGGLTAMDRLGPEDHNTWPTGKMPKENTRSQLDAIIKLLKEKQETRQAIMVMWRSYDLLHAIIGDQKDLPCTLALNFIVRNGKLNMIATMRSNDLWLGFTNDIYCFCCIQQIVAQALGLELGWYQHQATSLHYYLRNAEKVLLAASPPAFQTEPLAVQPTMVKLNDQIPVMLELEKYTREKKLMSEHTLGLPPRSLFELLVSMTATKWASNRDSLLSRIKIISPVMAAYVEEHFNVDS